MTSPDSLMDINASVQRALRIDGRVPDGCAWVPAGVSGSEALAGQFGDLILEKV